jgi:hypothetical protein
MRYVILLFILLLSAGCSRTGLLYENADWLAYRWTARLVDGTAEQREIWREAFRETLEVHRARLLPEVVAWLAGLERVADGDLERHQVECLVDQAGALYRVHAKMLVPLGLEVLSGLSPAQASHMAERLAERNAEYREDYLDPDPQRRRAERIARHRERIERWTGPLTPDQVALLERHLERLPDGAQAWLDYRESQQARMIRLVRTQPAALEPFLVDWWVELAGRSPELEARHAAGRAVTVDIVLELAAELGPDQWSRFRDRVGRLRADLASLVTAPASRLTQLPALPGCT